MKKFFIIIGLMILSHFLFFSDGEFRKLPVIAIANYGPHSSLNSAIEGLKKGLEERGYVDGRNITYQMADAAFDSSLIPQMLDSLLVHKPKMMVALTTPVAQYTKSKVKKIPIIYLAITDPVEAGLLNEKDKGVDNISGSSDMQNLEAFLEFTKKLNPNYKNIGLLYSTSEANDLALLKMMKDASEKFDMNLVTVAIDQARDIPTRIQEFRGKVDFLYVGTSGPIQPALPTIAAEAKKMNIPIFNVEEQAVRDHMVLASFGVNYNKVGRNAAKIIIEVMRDKPMEKIVPAYPEIADHKAVISKKQAAKFGIKIPEDLEAELVD